MNDGICILGGGVSGLSAGWASGAPIYEATAVPGGICSSYYMRPGDTERLMHAPEDGEAYRFERGGGHWVFGGDPVVLRFIRRLVRVRTYQRRSGVFFSEDGTYVPYPLQNHLAHLGPELATQAMYEMLTPPTRLPDTMDAWLEARFGTTLTERFFGPFHERYTAGLWSEIAPQDPYKSPVDATLVLRGALGEVPAAGYNVQFLYPEAGLDTLSHRLAEECDIRYSRRAVSVDLERKRINFEDGTEVEYATLLSTLPLDTMVAIADLAVNEVPDPHTSVLVLNIGARRGPACPEDHWLYIPDSKSGFFRVGCYSNVDTTFLPAASRDRRDRASFYIERAFPGKARPATDESAVYIADVIKELQAWRFIEEVEVADPTWIETAYTWKRPGSHWREEALAALATHDVIMVGRYGRWVFQGIADSIRDGLMVGAAVAGVRRC